MKLKTHGLSGNEGRQNDHFTDAHQLVTKIKEGAVTTKGIYPKCQVIWSLFIYNVKFYIAVSRKVIKSLQHGGEPFRHAGGSPETPVCGGEISACVYARVALLSPGSSRKILWAIYVLYGSLLAFSMEKLIHAGVEADCAASGRGKLEVHEDN